MSSIHIATSSAPPLFELDRVHFDIGPKRLLDDVSQEIPTSLLPAFLTATLGAPASALGLIEGISNGLSASIGFAGAAWQVGALRAAAWSARGLRTPAPRLGEDTDAVLREAGLSAEQIGVTGVELG